MTEKIENSYKTRVDDIMNQTLVGMNLAMAYEVGIIQALTHSDAAMTSQEVAEAKNLKERYVRELLNSLACAHVVEVETVEGALRYHIARENRAVFDPVMTPFLQLPASCAVRFQRLRDCITKDGPYGLPYGNFPVTLDALQRMSEAKLETEIKLTMDNIPEIQSRLEAGITVIELGSGSAFFISEMARRFPNSTFIGSDYCLKTLHAARKSVASLKLQNLNLIQMNIFDIPAEHTAKYDLAIVNDVIHDLPDSEAGLRGTRQVLKPGGYLAMYEIGSESDVMVGKELPGTAVPYAVSAFHCVPEAYHNETSNPLGCCWGKDTAIQYSEKAGLKVISQHSYFGIFILYVCQAV